MSGARRFGLTALVLGVFAAPAVAQERVYSGTEAQALQCAAYVSYTPLVLERRGLMSARDTQEAAVDATLILGSHVSGTYDQKRRAFEIALSRLPQSENALISEAVRRAGWCKEKFLR